MKKLILAGIVIIICCLVFLIVKQNTSRADIGMDIWVKPYTVIFSDWVMVHLKVNYEMNNMPAYFVSIEGQVIEGKVRLKVRGEYRSNTEAGRIFYTKILPEVKKGIKQDCMQWTLQGYPISLNDFEFDIQAIQ